MSHSLSIKNSLPIPSQEKPTDGPPLKKKSESLAHLFTQALLSKTVDESEGKKQNAGETPITTPCDKSLPRPRLKRKINEVKKEPNSKELISSDSKRKKLNPDDEENPDEFWNHLPQSFWEQVDGQVKTSQTQSQKQDQQTSFTPPPSISKKQQHKKPDDFWDNLPPTFWSQLDALEKGKELNNKTITRSSSTSLKQQQEYIGARFERIAGSTEHVEELVSLIDSTENKLEIFSWTLGYLDTEVFNSLLEAAKRNVEIILTVNDVTRESTYDTLEDIGIQVNAGRVTHTKFLIADESTALIGSYNFLGANSEEEEGIDESSFCISGNTELLKRIRGRIYRDMIAYERGEPPLLNPLCVKLKHNSNFYLLTNLGHHETFFKSMCQTAKERMIIYSPFVHYRNALKRLKILEMTASPKVKVLIHVLPEHAQHLKWALDKCPKLKANTTIQVSSFHRKSLIIDPESSKNCFFSEGSFNWLSATTDQQNEASNQETTVALSGPAAQKYFDFDPIYH